MKKPLFYLLIFSLLLNISSCKKAFDKDYYKDCVGEDRVSGDAILIIDKLKQTESIIGHNDWGYNLSNALSCQYPVICGSVFVVKQDSLSLFKEALAKTINTRHSELISNILSIDTTKQSVIAMPYFYYPDPSYPYYFVSNSYDVHVDSKNRLITIFYERRKPRGKEKISLTLEASICFVVINKVIKEGFQLNYTYYENKCR